VRRKPQLTARVTSASLSSVICKSGKLDRKGAGNSEAREQTTVTQFTVPEYRSRASACQCDWNRFTELKFARSVSTSALSIRRTSRSKSRRWALLRTNQRLEWGSGLDRRRQPRRAMRTLGVYGLIFISVPLRERLGSLGFSDRKTRSLPRASGPCRFHACRRGAALMNEQSPTA